MAAIDREMDAAFQHYSPEDGRSWWAETADGTARAVRLQRFEEHSPTFTALLTDDRFLRIGRLTGDDYEARTGGEALEKPIGVVKGISDLMWHKDCALGMHSYRCCGLTVGISVTGADEGSGQLAVVPGSHRALIQPGFYRKAWGLPIRQLPTKTGDITVHCSCTFHMSHAPVTSERRVIYTGFGLANRDEQPLEHEAQVRIIREEAHRKVSQAPGAVNVVLTRRARKGRRVSGGDRSLGRDGPGPVRGERADVGGEACGARGDHADVGAGLEEGDDRARIPPVVLVEHHDDPEVVGDRPRFADPSDRRLVEDEDPGRCEWILTDEELRTEQRTAARPSDESSDPARPTSIMRRAVPG